MSSVKLWIMCGRSFSGKSTRALEIAQVHKAEIVSFDMINLERGLISGTGLDINEWIETTRIAHERASNLLRQGHSVVIDDTNSLKQLRDAWRKTAQECQVAFELVWLPISFEDQTMRIRANRENPSRADIKDEVLKAHNESFEEPDPAEIVS